MLPLPADLVDPDDPENEWVDEDSDLDSINDDFDHDSEISNDSSEGWGREYVSDWELDPITAADLENDKKYPAILRANRQIYNEASSLFYTEATLVVDPEDIFCLAKKPYALNFGVPSDEPVWRYDPLKSVGKMNENGRVTYETLEMGG